MIRQKIFKTFLAVITMGFIVSCNADNLSEHTKEKTPVLDKHYEVMKEQIQYDKPTLTEFFWLGCGHCFSAEPIVKKWMEEMPELTLELVAVPGGKRWTMDAKVFLTMENFNLDKGEMFNFYHKNKKLPTLKAIIEYFNSKGVTKDDFNKVYNGFKMSTQINKSKILSKKAGAFSTPTFVVNGKYKVLSRAHRSWDDIQNTIKHLSNK